MNVYGGWVIHRHRLGQGVQVRVIVRARSRAAVIRALAAHGIHVSPGFIRDYWSVTGNTNEIQTAGDTEGVVFATNGMRCGGEFEAERLPTSGGAE